MTYQFVIGMDISKHSFDVAIFSVDNHENIYHKSFTNDRDGFNELVVFANNTVTAFDISRSLFCMEATGLYCNALLEFFQKQQANVWVENPVQIKRSIGIKRGKTDKVDSIRIANYAFKNAELARLWKPSGVVLEKIKILQH